MNIKVVTHGYLRSKDRYIEEFEIEVREGINSTAFILSSIGLDPNGRFAIFIDRKRVKGETAFLHEGNGLDVFSIVGGG